MKNNNDGKQEEKTPIGSPKSDLEFVLDDKGKPMDVICRKDGKPIEPDSVDPLPEQP